MAITNKPTTENTIINPEIQENTIQTPEIVPPTTETPESASKNSPPVRKKTIKNTSPVRYDEDEETETSLDKEELLMNEDDYFNAILTMSSAKNNPDNFHQINIERSGTPILSFRVRPLSQKENMDCVKQGTKSTSNRKTGNIIKDIDTAKVNSYLIYTATIDEDRKKLWDNKKAKNQLNIFDGVDMIDEILLAGEKSSVINIIDEISGFQENNVTTGELAKNS